MNCENHLYKYLYDDLVAQIECGVLEYAQALPSQKQLCQQYNVGITTVRKVMRLLQEAGYVESSQGLPAKVAYHAAQHACFGALASRRSAIHDAFQGLRLLLPSLYRQGAMQIQPPQLALMQQAIDTISETDSLPALYQRANLFFMTLLRPFHNCLMLDLELDAENYLHIPYTKLSQLDNPYELSADRLKRTLQALIDLIHKKQYDAFYESIRQIYLEAGYRVDIYLEQLQQYISEDSSGAGALRWFRVKDRSELYTKLAMTLLRRIAAGEFEDQSYLPSIPRLMEEYGVMKDTASRAIGLLSKMGVIQTIQRKGTVVLSTNETTHNAGAVDFQDSVVRQRLSSCLDALEIMALGVSSCVVDVSGASEQWACSMEYQLSMAPYNRFTPLSVQLLMKAAIEFTPYHSLKNIFRQLDELVIWGYYLKSVDESLYPNSDLVVAAMNDVAAAIRQPEKHSISKALETAFSQIYQDVFTVIARVGDTADLAVSRKEAICTVLPAHH